MVIGTTDTTIGYPPIEAPGKPVDEAGHTLVAKRAHPGSAGGASYFSSSGAPHFFCAACSCRAPVSFSSGTIANNALSAISLSPTLLTAP